MKQVLSALRGARRIEWILLVAALAVAALLIAQGGGLNLSAEPSDATALEKRMEQVLSLVDGAGKVRVLVNEQTPVRTAYASADDGTTVISGVVIVAEGASDLRVAMELSLAVKTLLNVELDVIEVLAMNGGK